MLEKKLDELNKELFKTKEENEQLTLARADLENEKVSMFFYKSLILSYFISNIIHWFVFVEKNVLVEILFLKQISIGFNMISQSMS